MMDCKKGNTRSCFSTRRPGRLHRPFVMSVRGLRPRRNLPQSGGFCVPQLPRVMKTALRFLPCAAFALGIASAQTTLHWRSEASNGSWNDASNWWNGSSTQSPPGAEILVFDNNNQTAMTNDAAATTRHQIVFEAGASTVRTIGGSPANQFVAVGGNGPLIRNNSSAAHILNFPLAVGDDGLTLDTANGALNLNGAISGSGTITKVTGGSDGNQDKAQNAVVSANNGGFTGKWVVTGGNLSINSDAALGAVPAAPVADAITLNGGSLANMSQASGGGFSAGHDLDLHANRGITLGAGGGNIRIGYGKTVTINGAITGTGLLSRSDGGILVLNNAGNSYGGITHLRAGIIRTGVSGTLPSTTNVLLWGGSTLDLNGTTQTIAGIHVGGTGDTNTTLQLGANGNLTVTGNSMPAGSPNNVGGDFHARITGTGGAITYNNSASHTGNWNWLNTGNNFQGTITVVNGRLRATDVTLGNSSNGVTFDGDVVATLGNAQGRASIQQTSGTSITFSATRTFTINAGKEGTFYTWGSQTITVDGQVTGGGNLRKEDGGTLRLTNPSNNYGGLTRIATGTLQLGASGVIPDTSVVEMAGGTLATNNLPETVAGLFGTGGTVSGGNNLTVLTADSLNFAGSINNTTLRMAGTGTQTLSGTGDNSSGRAIIDSGTLVFAKSGATTSRAVGQSNGAVALTVNGGTLLLAGAHGDQIYGDSTVEMSGGLLDMNGRSESIRGLIGTGGVIRNDAPSTTSTLTVGEIINPGTADYSFGGAIEDGAGTTALAKTGTGTQTLTAANTYTGPTTVAAGVLALSGSGSISGSTTIDVASGATLDVSGVSDNPWTLGASQTLEGNGTVYGGLTAAGHIAPGNSIGMLDVSGDLTISGTLDVEYDGDRSLIDLLAVTGNLDISGATVDFSPLNSALTGSPHIFASYGSLTGSQFNVVADLPAGYTIDYNYAGNNIALIPEPTAALLAGLGALGLLRRRRHS